MTLPVVEKDYPPPSLSSKTKADLLLPFKDDVPKIHNKAEKAPKECLDSFDTLRDYLQKEGVTTELAKVRFFFEWLLMIVAKEEPVPSTRVKQPVSPRDWLTRCRDDFEMYTDFFTVLCRSSGVKCAIIKGYVKGAGFEEEKASKRNCPRGRWVAVHVAGEWRFINPSWAFYPATQGEDKDPNTFKWVASDEKSVMPQANQTLTEEKNEEFWFLTEPAAFNAFCHAEDSKWQLLESVWTDKEFLQTPKYAEEYFKSSKWQLVIGESGVLKAEKGKCIIPYTQNVSATTAYLKFNMYMKKLNTIKDQPNLNRFVRTEYVGKGQINLITRLPQNGLYKIEIAGVLDGDLQPLNEFVINAVNVPKKPEPFPESCDDLGVLPEAWQHQVDATEQRGIVLVPEEKEGEGTKRKIELKFSVPVEKSDTALGAFLTHSYRKDDDIQKFVDVKATKNDVNKKVETTVTFCLSKDDDKSLTFEYCLTIKKGDTPLVRYILTSDKELTFPSESAIIQDKISLLTAIGKSNMSEVEKMLTKFNFNTLDPNIRNLIASLRQTIKKGNTLQPITHVTKAEIKDPQAEPEITNDPQPPDNQTEPTVTQMATMLSEVEEAVRALRMATKDSNSATHQADLESALALALGLGVQRGDYDGVINAAETVLIKLYEVELKRCVRRNIRKEIEAALQHTDASCIADQIKKTEAYVNAAKLPVKWK